MLRFNSFNNFIKNYKKNKISLVYGFETNASLSKINNLISVILNKKNSFVFESVEKAIHRGRYSIFGYDSDKTYEIKNNQIYIDGKRILNSKPYEYLKKLIKKFDYKLPKNLPKMSLMLIGYFGYDIIRFIEKIPNNTKDDLKIPDVRLQRPRKIIIHDNLKSKIFYISCDFNIKKISQKSYEIEKKRLLNLNNEVSNYKQEKFNKTKGIKIKLKSLSGK